MDENSDTNVQQPWTRTVTNAGILKLTPSNSIRDIRDEVSVVVVVKRVDMVASVIAEIFQRL